MKRTRNMVYKPSDNAAELCLYAVTDSRIYHNYAMPVVERAKKKAAKGNYSLDALTDAFYQIATEAARLYSKQFGTRFTVTERFTAAADMASLYEAEYIKA